MSSRGANWKKIKVVNEQCGFHTLGFHEFRHTEPVVSSHSKTQEKVSVGQIAKL